MDQDSQNNKPAPGENDSLIRRCLHALQRREVTTRRTVRSQSFGLFEALEVRQVLSGAPLAFAPGVVRPVDQSPVELTETERLFAESAIQQIDLNIRQVWDLTINSMADRPKFADGNRPDRQTFVAEVISNEFPSRSEVFPELSVSAPLWNNDKVDDLFWAAEKTADSAGVEIAIEDQTQPVIDDPVVTPPVESVAAPVVPADDIRWISAEISAELAFAPPVVQTPLTPLAPRVPRSQESLEVQVRFEWDSPGTGIEVQLPNESMMVITIRGESSGNLSAEKRQWFEDTISRATMTLVQSFAPGTSVHVSLFTTLKTGTAGDQRVALPAAIQRSDSLTDAMEASDGPLDKLTNREIPALESADLAVLQTRLTRERDRHLDVVFESIDTVLFSTLDEMSRGILQDESAQRSQTRSSTVAETAAQLSENPAGPVKTSDAGPSGTLNGGLSNTALSDSPADSGSIAAILIPTTDGKQSDQTNRLQRTPAAAVLRLLFDEDRTYETADVLKSRIAPDSISVTVSTSAEPTAVRRQRVSQRDASNTSLLSFWQVEEKTLPPVPSSDGAPREIQLAERSRGPPLLRSARDDLLTDYTAPANLLERLRYSISPRGPSLVTVDVQLPEFLVLFGAES